VSTVSVVIPVYNAARYLGEALDTVLAQTRQPDEIVLADDASTDRSREVAAEYAARDPRIRVLHHERNRGSGPTRNTGVRGATGEIIAFMDADDLWAPEHLGTVVGLLERYPDAAVASTHARAFGDRDDPFLHRIPLGPPTRVFWQALDYWIVPQNAIAVRASAFHAVGGYDEERMRLAEDYDFILRLAWRYPFVGSERFTVGWRRHATQQSTQHDEAQYSALRRRRADFVNAAAASASPEDLARMRAVVLKRWWDLVYEAGGAGDRRQLRRLVADGPALTNLPPREALRVRLRRVGAPLYFSAAAAPLRTLHAAAVRVLRRGGGGTTGGTTAPAGA
jgi:glycosyltransferase involved in cell wall biosynthesis